MWLTFDAVWPKPSFQKNLLLTLMVQPRLVRTTALRSVPLCWPLASCEGGSCQVPWAGTLLFSDQSSFSVCGISSSASAEARTFPKNHFDVSLLPAPLSRGVRRAEISGRACRRAVLTFSQFIFELGLLSDSQSVEFNLCYACVKMD